MRLLTVVVAALSILAGLGSAGGSAAADEMRKVRIGTEGAYPPFNYIDSAGDLQGFDIDIAKALCHAAGFDCVFVLQDWDGMIPALQAGKYDAIVASMGITEKRREVVDFTKKYYNAPAKFVGAEGADFDFAQPDGLAGLRIGVQGASTHEDFVRAKWPSAEVVTYTTQEEANADLVSGRLDLAMANSVVLLEGLLKSDGGEGLAFLGPDFYDPAYHGEGAGIAVRKGEQDLIDAFNAAIARIRADGTYKEINDRYFTFDLYGE